MPTRRGRQVIITYVKRATPHHVQERVRVTQDVAAPRFVMVPVRLELFAIVGKARRS